MKYQGKIKNIGNDFFQDYKNKKFDEEKIYTLEIKEKKSEKTDGQRSRYWTMVRQYARLLKVPQEEIHNRMLCDLGILQYDNEGIPKTELHSPDYNYLRDMYVHLKPTSAMVKTDKGQILRVYYVLKNSEDFTTDEFSDLIEYLIRDILENECDDKIDINYQG